MPVPNDGFAHSASYQSNRLKQIRQANYDSALNYAYLNLYAAQNYGNPGNVSTAEAAIDRDFGLNPPLFRSETIQEFRANYQPGHRPVTIPQKPHFPNPKEHVIYQPVEKTEREFIPSTVKLEEKKYESEPVSYETPEVPLGLTPYVEPSPEEEFEQPGAHPFEERKYSEDSKAYGIPQFKDISKGTTAEIIHILGSYYGLPGFRTRNALVSALRAHQSLLKQRAESENAYYPTKPDMVRLSGYQSRGRQIGHGIERSGFFRDLLSKPSKSDINFAGSQANTARDFYNFSKQKSGGAMANRRKILAGEVGAGNDNPEVKRMLKQLGSMKLRKVPISAY